MENKDNFEYNNQENLIEETADVQGESVPVKKSVGREIGEWILSIAIALIIAMVLRDHVMLMAKVDGNSMLPTLHHNERLVVWRLGYKAHSGDIVILNPPTQARGPYVKRVIATEGDTVRIDSSTGSVFVNGEKIDEPYIDDAYITTAPENEYIVPEGYFFVMGDNRSPGGSYDSRAIGCIPNENMIGKVVFRWWPLNMVGIPK